MAPGEKPGQWVQVGDEQTGFYWVYAGESSEQPPEAEVSYPTRTSRSFLSPPLPRLSLAAQTQAQADAVAESQAQRMAEDPSMSAEEKQYQAFQLYYYQNGYPYYYADDGNVVYYDPAAVDEQTRLYYESRGGGVSTAHAAGTDGEAAPQPGYYEEYGVAPAETANGSGNAAPQYHSYFAGYGEVDGPVSQTHPGADTPLYG